MLTALLDNPTVHGVEVEFIKVTNFDSSVLDMLKHLYESARRVNKPIVLLNPSSLMLKVFGAAGLSTFNIQHTLLLDIKNRRVLSEQRDSVSS